MKMQNIKPAIVPTLSSARVLLWSIVYLAIFGAVLAVYCQYGRLGEARERRSRPVETKVSCRYFRTLLPAGWAYYAETNDTVMVFRDGPDRLPMLQISAVRSPDLAYRGVDQNPAVSMRKLGQLVSSLDQWADGKETVLVNLGCELLPVKPGITAKHLQFTDYDRLGELVTFYSGEVRYTVWGACRMDDRAAADEISAYLRHLFERFSIPEMREMIDRPVFDSGRITPEMNASVQALVAREMALWRLFASRARTQAETSLLPAIEHYREAIRLLSSIGQESQALTTPDFARYCEFVETRRQRVSEWFVQLDKLVAMRNWKEARTMAKWIVDHATLVGELVDRRRATDVLEDVIPPEEKAGAK